MLRHLLAVPALVLFLGLSKCTVTKTQVNQMYTLATETSIDRHQENVWEQAIALNINTAQPSTITALFVCQIAHSAEVRVKVDDRVAVPTQSILSSGGDEGTRSFVGTAAHVAPGQHKVSVEWRSHSGGGFDAANLINPTLTVWEATELPQ